MRLRNRCRNGGELLKLKESLKPERRSFPAGMSAAGKGSVAGGHAFGAGFEATMEPHILFRGHHDALLNDLVHPRGGGFRVVQRRGTLWRQDNQFITFTVRFAARTKGTMQALDIFASIRCRRWSPPGRPQTVGRRRWRSGRNRDPVRTTPLRLFSARIMPFRSLRSIISLLSASGPSLQPVDHRVVVGAIDANPRLVHTEHPRSHLE